MAWLGRGEPCSPMVAGLGFLLYALYVLLVFSWITGAAQRWYEKAKGAYDRVTKKATTKNVKLARKKSKDFQKKSGRAVKEAEALKKTMAMMQMARA